MNQFAPQSENIASIFRGYKSAVTTYARKNNINFAWQSRFHDHIIRNEQEFQRIREYIINNPKNWEMGKPQQNAIIERFNKTFREDVLDANIFKSIEHTEEITKVWIEEYNNERPHQSLNYYTPSDYAA